MIRFRLAELIADAQFRTGKRITFLELSEATGITRMTLSRMANMRGYSTSTETLDRLCHYFQCDLSDVAEYVADDAVGQRTSPVKAPAKASKPSSEKKSTRRVMKRA